ncbi:MAG: PP2C family protein-serine/threonine phosphatase [Thermoanaerobaculia bacterium]|nr:PP2C family protein-serine/threonine phosphatase [Thermoanaerobaculia bacterium]
MNLRIEKRVLPQSLGGWLRNVALALALGAFIGFVLWLASPEESLVLLLPISAWIGLSCYLTCITTLAFVAPYLDLQAGGPRLWVPLGIVFFLAGGAGFFLGAWLVEWVTRHRVSFGTPGLGDSFAFAGLLGLVGGVIFFTYESLKGRLEESLARIKDQELAERELETARKIQRRILPPATLEVPGFRIAARNLPARVVAGDFYDYLPRADGGVGVVVADVVGKGMGASLIMAGVKARLGYVASGRSVAEAMAELNRELCEELDEREFVALAYASFDADTGRFELANAGLPDPYVLGREGASAVRVGGPRLPLGVRGEVIYESVEGVLEPGESLLLLTDGVPESPTASGDPLGYEELESFLAVTEIEGAPAERLEALVAALEGATVAGRDDDWTLVLVQREPVDSGS